MQYRNEFCLMFLHGSHIFWPYSLSPFSSNHCCLDSQRGKTTCLPSLATTNCLESQRGWSFALDVFVWVLCSHKNLEILKLLLWEVKSESWPFTFFSAWGRSSLESQTVLVGHLVYLRDIVALLPYFAMSSWPSCWVTAKEEEETFTKLSQHIYFWELRRHTPGRRHIRRKK